MGGLRQRKGRPLRCRDLRYRVLMYAEGVLEGPGREAVEAHLETCGACREMAKYLRDVTLAVRILRDEAAMAPDVVWLARLARQKAIERRGFRSLAARASSWVDDVAGPLVERPAEALLASGLVLWLAVLNVTSAFGLERLVAKLAALALVRVGLLGI